MGQSENLAILYIIRKRKTCHSLQSVFGRGKISKNYKMRTQRTEKSNAVRVLKRQKKNYDPVLFKLQGCTPIADNEINIMGTRNIVGENSIRLDRMKNFMLSV